MCLSIVEIWTSDLLKRLNEIRACPRVSGLSIVEGVLNYVPVRFEGSRSRS